MIQIVNGFLILTGYNVKFISNKKSLNEVILIYEMNVIFLPNEPQLTFGGWWLTIGFLISHNSPSVGDVMTEERRLFANLMSHNLPSVGDDSRVTI